MDSKKMPRTPRSGCPIGFALDILGDRWTLLIIRDIVFEGKRTYGEFLLSEERIATNILADRLQRLECAGILKKKIDQESRTRLHYELTKKGIDLVPVLIDLAVWGAKYDPKTAAPKAFIKRSTMQREALIEEIVRRLKAGRSDE